MKKLLIIFGIFIIHGDLVGQNMTENITHAYNILNSLNATKDPLDFELDYQKALDLIKKYEAASDKPLQTEIIYFMSKVLVIFHLQYPADFYNRHQAALSFIKQARDTWTRIGTDRRYPEYIRAYLRYNGINNNVFQDREDNIHARLSNIVLPLDTFDKSYLQTTAINSSIIRLHRDNITACYEKIQANQSKDSIPLLLAETINAIKNFDITDFATQNFVKLSLNSVYLYCKSWIFMQQLNLAPCVSKIEVEKIDHNLKNAQLYIKKMQTGAFASAEYIEKNMNDIGMTSSVILKLRAQIKAKSKSLTPCPQGVTVDEMRQIVQIKRKSILRFEDFKKIAKVPSVFLTHEPIKFLVEIPPTLTFKAILDCYDAQNPITKDVYFINLKSLNQDFLKTYDNARTLMENDIIPMKPNMKFLWLTNPAGMGISKGGEAVTGQTLERATLIIQTAFSIFNGQ